MLKGWRKHVDAMHMSHACWGDRGQLVFTNHFHVLTCVSPLTCNTKTISAMQLNRTSLLIVTGPLFDLGETKGMVTRS